MFELGLIVMSVVMASLPWLSNHFFFIKPEPKKTWMYLIECLSSCAITLMFLLIIEYQLNGIIHSQGWEFYIVWLCLFTIFSFPAFIYQVVYKQMYSS